MGLVLWKENEPKVGGTYYNYEMAWKLGGGGRLNPDPDNWSNLGRFVRDPGPTGVYFDKQGNKYYSYQDQITGKDNAYYTDSEGRKVVSEGGQNYVWRSEPFYGDKWVAITVDGKTRFKRDFGVMGFKYYFSFTSISGTTGVGLSLEFALPGVIIRELRENDYTGVGIDFGILKDSKGRGLYFTFKKTKKFAVVGSASIEWFGARNKGSSSLIDVNRTYIDGYGFELGIGFGPVSGAYSTDQGSEFGRGSIYEIYTGAIGIGIEAGYVEWDTRTFVSGKRKF